MATGYRIRRSHSPRFRDKTANADRRADELETEGDHAGAAIWRRATVAIEQLTDTTGPLH
jgi:hypothetical protein